LDALKQLTLDFMKIYTTPTGNKKNKAKLTANLNQLFKTADAGLTKIDNQVNTLFDTDPDFCDEYQRRRVVVNLAARLRAFQMWIWDDETSQPFGKAVVKITKKDDSELINGLQSTGVSRKIPAKKTGVRGGISINNMATGEYLYEISFGGYITQTGSFFINDGVMTEVIVRLKRNIE